jgi:hypothetical protein
VSNEPTRAGFDFAALPGGRRILEHVILHLRHGLIARQVDV